MIALIIKCFLAGFTGRSHDVEREGQYMRKRFGAVTETETDRKAIKDK